MSFKLKTFNKLLNLHPTSNKLDNIIKYVPMRNKRKWGYIDENKTIFVNEDLRYKDKVKTIKHEKVHKKQMEEGRLKFNSLFYHWTPKNSNETFKISTKDIDTRRRDLPWELEADGKTPPKDHEIIRNIKRKRK